jgi:hypothetical protein
MKIHMEALLEGKNPFGDSTEAAAPTDDDISEMV